MMKTRRTLDRSRGANPVIRSEGDSLTFEFHIVGLPDRATLFLRCDASGDVLVSAAVGRDQLLTADR